MCVGYGGYEQNWGLKMWGRWRVGCGKLREQEGKWERGRGRGEVHTFFCKKAVCRGWRGWKGTGKDDKDWGPKMWGRWKAGRRELGEQEGKWKRGGGRGEVHTYFFVRKSSVGCGEGGGI